MSQYHKNDIMHFTEVTLLIRSFKRSLEFYVDILGFSILEKEGHKAVLSANNIDPLITLIEDRNALAPNITLGLYHYALLLPNRKDFAQMIHRIANHHLLQAQSRARWLLPQLVLHVGECQPQLHDRDDRDRERGRRGGQSRWVFPDLDVCAL